VALFIPVLEIPKPGAAVIKPGKKGTKQGDILAFFSLIIREPLPACSSQLTAHSFPSYSNFRL